MSIIIFLKKNRKSLLILGTILLLTINVFGNCLHDHFIVGDDTKNIYQNSYILNFSFANIKNWFTQPLIGMYTPLVYFSYALDYKIGKFDPRIYHLTNLLLHLINITLVFLVVKSLTQRMTMATWVTLFFAIHPLMMSVLASVSTRSTLMYSLFFLAGLYCYIYYVKNHFRTRYLVLTFILYFLAVLSKSAAVVFPLVMLLIDYYYKRKFDTKTQVEKIPFFLVSLVFGVLTFYFREQAGHLGLTNYSFSIVNRVFVLIYALTFYVTKLFLPIKLSAYYPYSPEVRGFLPLEYYFSPLIFVAFGLLFYLGKKVRREIMFGTLFFLINIVLVLKAIPIGDDFASERYAYLPSLGLLLMAGWIYHSIIDNVTALQMSLKMGFAAMFVLFGFSFSYITYERNTAWENSNKYYDNVIAAYPEFTYAYFDRGALELLQGNLQSALADTNQCIKLNPNYALAYNNRGIIKKGLHDYPGAVADFNRALAINPKLMSAYVNLGNLARERKDYLSAFKEYNRAIAADPSSPDGYYNRGTIELAEENYNAAIADFDKALAINPNYTNAYLNRGSAVMAQMHVAANQTQLMLSPMMMH